MPDIDDIEEDQIDIDDLINQEEPPAKESEDEEEVKEGAAGPKKNREWDQQQLYDLLQEVGDAELEVGEDEEDFV